MILQFYIYIASALSTGREILAFEGESVLQQAFTRVGRQRSLEVGITKITKHASNN